MRGACESYKMHYDNAQAEIKRLKEKYSRMKFNLESVLAERADHTEAIKEFESKVLDLFPIDKDFTTISRFTVKRIVKEMEGE